MKQNETDKPTIPATDRISERARTAAPRTDGFVMQARKDGLSCSKGTRRTDVS